MINKCWNGNMSKFILFFRARLYTQILIQVWGRFLKESCRSFLHKVVVLSIFFKIVNMRSDKYAGNSGQKAVIALCSRQRQIRKLIWNISCDVEGNYIIVQTLGKFVRWKWKLQWLHGLILRFVYPWGHWVTIYIGNQWIALLHNDAPYFI